MALNSQTETSIKDGSLTFCCSDGHGQEWTQQTVNAWLISSTKASVMDQTMSNPQDNRQKRPETDGHSWGTERTEGPSQLQTENRLPLWTLWEELKLSLNQYHMSAVMQDQPRPSESIVTFPGYRNKTSWPVLRVKRKTSACTIIHANYSHLENTQWVCVAYNYQLFSVSFIAVVSFGDHLKPGLNHC